MNEHEKKRAYNEGILQTDHGTFTPLVFSINGSMVREFQKVLLAFGTKESEKRDLP